MHDSSVLQMMTTLITGTCTNEHTHTQSQQSFSELCVCLRVCVCISRSPGAQGEGGLLRMRAAPAGEGGLMLLEGVVVRSEWEGSESRCRGDRALQSSSPLEAAAVAELQVALALRG